MLGHAGIVGAETAYRSRECFPVCLMDERHGSPRTLSEDGEEGSLWVSRKASRTVHTTHDRGSYLRRPAMIMRLLGKATHVAFQVSRRCSSQKETCEPFNVAARMCVPTLSDGMRWRLQVTMSRARRLVRRDAP